MAAAFVRLLNSPLESTGCWQKLLADKARAIIAVARMDVYDRLKLHAQALTYDTLLALIPLLAVVFSAVRTFGGMRDVGDRFEQLIVRNISGSPEMQQMVGGYLAEFVNNIQAGQIGSVSIVILVFSVLSLLGHIEFAFNSIFGSATPRPLMTRLLVYWSALTLGPLLLAASFALTAALQTSSVGSALHHLPWAKRWFVSALPMLATWLAFLAMYLVVPHARVRWVAAVPAAIVAGSLWNGAKLGYAVYAKNAFTLQNIYGSLAAIPLFILWLYVSWLLVLFGAQLAFAFQSAETYTKYDDRLDLGQVVKERAACRLMLEVARDFYTGRSPTDPHAVGMTLGLPRRLLSEILKELEAGGFVKHVEGAAGLVPGADLARLTVGGLLSHLRNGDECRVGLTDDAPMAEIDALLQRGEAARLAEVDQTSFRSLASHLEDNDNVGDAGLKSRGSAS